MIFHRIKAHVEKENWFAVAIDFAIVVVGVFIGIQVANWNEARAEKMQAKELVARMVSEAASTREELKDYQSFHKEVSESAAELTLVLNDNAACLAMDETLTIMILQVADFPPPRFSLPNAEQALETGSLALIRSSDLQKKVQSIADEMVFVERQWQRYVGVIQDSNLHVITAAGVALTGRGELITKLSYDPDSYELLTPEKVCKNTELIALMANVAVTKEVYVDYLSEVDLALGEYLSALNKGD